MNSLTKTQKMLLTIPQWKKNSEFLVHTLMILTDDVNMIVGMTKIYNKFIHDYFEKNPQMSPAMVEIILKKMTPKWFLNKIKNDPF